MPSWIVIDFETASACDLTACGAWRYAEDPTTEVLCLSFETERGTRGTWHPGLPIPPAVAFALANGFMFVAHNMEFERAEWHHQMVAIHGWPPLPLAQTADTMAVCALRGVPPKLEKALPAMDLPMSKDMEGNKLTLSLSKVNPKTGMYPVRTQAMMLRIYQYCESDIAGQTALHRRMGWLPDYERWVWELNQTINARGLRLDMEFVRSAQSIVDKASGPLADEFRQITGYNFEQRDKIIAWAKGRGVVLENMTKEYLAELLGEDDEDEDFEPVERVIQLPADVERALRIRQLIGSSSIKKLSRMAQCVNSDGRARGLLQYHGTSPGRNTSRLFQAHNFPRGTIKVGDYAPDPEEVVAAIKTRDPAYVEMLYGPAVETVVSTLRHAIVADPGRVLVAGDYAGIQARVVLALAGQHDKTALMASGMDVYCDMAAQIYKRPIDKKKDPAERQIGKNSVLGLGFQMGWRKFRLKYAKELTPEFCEEVVRVYRKEWAPKVPDVWYALDKASLRALTDGVPQEAYGVIYRVEDRWLTAQLPGGNKLWYKDPQVIRKAMPWSTEEEPDIRQAWTFKATKQKHTVTVNAFGGQLTENVVMGIERQIVVEAMRRCEENGFPVILDVHDEIVTEPLTSDSNLPKALEQIMLDVKPWVTELQVPIAVDVWQSQRYKK
jgi:DNA polymerase